MEQNSRRKPTGRECIRLPAVRAGKYVLRFEIPGFVPAERTLTVLVGQVATVDVALQLASASTTVAVEAAAAAVDTSTSTVAGDVSPTEVSRVPLNGRNYLQLAMMVPGITSNDVTNSPLGTTDGGKLQINVDGQQVTQNSAGDSFGEPQYSQDAIDQFQIITNRFDATLGRSSRVQVNVQTKSGSNQFHGTLYGYFRNSDFNASDPVAHKVLPFSDQQFGGTFGGPILKNKLFFFFAYEGRAAAEHHLRCAHRIRRPVLHIQQRAAHQQLPSTYGLADGAEAPFVRARDWLHLGRALQQCDRKCFADASHRFHSHQLCRAGHVDLDCNCHRRERS